MSLSYAPPIRHRRPLARRDHARRDHAIELFGQGKVLPAIRETFRYLLQQSVPDLSRRDFHFVQGSARIHARVDGDELVLTSALASVGRRGASTAALRFFLSRTSSTGQIYQPRLANGVLALEFRDRLALMHPLKLAEALERLPMEADRTDTWLGERFGVATPDREPGLPLTPAERRRAVALWQRHWSEIDALMAESRRRRSVRLLDAIGAIAVYRVHDALPLSGAVRVKLNESADVYTDREQNPTRRDAALARCVRQMREIDGAALLAALGHRNYAIDPLRPGSPQLITGTFSAGNRLQVLGELIGAGRALEAAVELHSCYYYLLANHAWPPPIENALRKALAAASGKGWQDAASCLQEHAHRLVRKLGNDSAGG